MVEARVRHHEPLAALARGERKFIRNQVGAEVAANLRFLADLSAAAKRGNLLFRKQPHRLAWPSDHAHAAAQHLGRLGAVADRRIQRVDPQPDVRKQFVPHVARRKVAEPRIGLLGHAGREKLMPSVKAADLHGPCAEIFQRAVPHQAEFLARASRQRRRNPSA